MLLSQIVYKLYIGEKPNIDKENYLKIKQKILLQIAIWAENGKNFECCRALDILKEIENE